MSVRVVWVLSLSRIQEGGDCLLFCRRFATVEKRLRVALADSYTPLTNDQEITTALCTEIGATDNLLQFSDIRDSCDKVEQKPVFEVVTKQGVVWPILVLQQNGLLYCCLPYVETTSSTKPPLVMIQSLSACFSLLFAMADFIGPSMTDINEQSSKLSDLYLFLGEAAPFGTICDTVVSSVRAKLNIRPQMVATDPSQVVSQPSWKPEVTKGKSQVNLSIAEQARVVLYNNIDKPDVVKVFGSVTCKADIEGVAPDVTINLSPSASGATTLNYLQTHPCVQSADTHILDEGKSRKATQRKIRFSPPTEPFTLCHYSISNPGRLPVTGAYHMKMDGRVANLDVKLYLGADFKNVFDQCELHLPFYNRGVIASHDTTSTTGSVSLSPDYRTLIWTIGQKFPSKLTEIVLASSVKFVEPRHAAANQYEDPFCVGNNAFAQLYFKMSNFTSSGWYIDPKSVQLSPVSKFRLTTATSFSSTEYKIWNSHGDFLST